MFFLAIRPLDFLGGIYSRSSVSRAPSTSRRIEALQKERAQLEGDAERLGLNYADSESPLVASHRSIVSKIDAELEALQNRQSIPMEAAGATQEGATAEEAQQPAVPKQVIQRMPNRQGIYPPGTFLDIYV